MKWGNVALQTWSSLGLLLCMALLSVQLLLLPNITVSSYQLYRAYFPDTPIVFTNQEQYYFTRLLSMSLFFPTQTNMNKVIDEIPFLPEEITHLKDIQYLVLISRIALLVVLSDVLGLFYLKHIGRLQQFRVFSPPFLIRLYGTVITTIFVVTTLWWDKAFHFFHSSLFAAGSWYFPEDSTFIQLYPESFWQWVAVEYVLLLSVLVLLPYFVMHRYIEETS